MKSYVYSITVEKENDSLAFLKAYDKKIKVNNTIVDKSNPIGVLLDGDETTSIGFVEEVVGETFEDLYKKWGELTKKFELSLEYVKEGYVYLLAFRQLHSGVDRPYNNIYIHNGVPSRRIKNKKKVDLMLRKAKDSDYGDSDSEEIPSIKELIIKPEWIKRWRQRVFIIKHLNGELGCWLPYEREVEILWRAFLLVVNDIHMVIGDTVPLEVNWLQVSRNEWGIIEIKEKGIVELKKIENYKKLIEDSYSIKDLGPMGNWIGRESLKEVIELYNLARIYFTL